MIPIDRLCYHSKLRYESPAVKLAFALITLTFCVVNRFAPFSLVILVIMGMLTVIKGGIPFFRYIKILTVPLVFLLMSSVAIAFDFGFWYITYSDASVRYAVNLIITALSAVSCLYFLSLTTPMTDILAVLSAMRVPHLIIELMMLIYRFIFLLLDTADAIQTAQDCRLGNRDYKTSLKSFSALCSALMVRAVTRSRVLYQAMEARCYDGTFKFLSEAKPASKRYKILLTIYALAFLIFTFRRFYYGQ